MTQPVITPTEFRELEQQLYDRRHAYQSRKIPQPLIRLWDKDMKLIARITIPETWECEEIAHDNGYARIEIVGKDNDWLRELIVFKTRPAEDLHISIDPDPSKPHDWRNRWGGKVETITDVETKGKPTVTTITAVSNRIHFRHILMASMPVLPHAVQIPKMFLWGGPCVSACASAVFVNLFRIYTLNGWWPLPRNLFDPMTWINNLSPLSWPIQIMPVRVLTDQSRWITIGARWQDAETVLLPAMKDAGVICHAYTWMGKSSCSGCAADCSGDSAPYEAFGPLKEQLKPTRPCVILSFEDQSGYSGPSGSAADGLIQLVAVTLDDLFTETLLAVDADGDGETDPFIRKILGVAPKRPPFVYRDTGYGGVMGRTTVVHKTKAITIVVGGRSPGWVWPLRVTPEGPGPAKLSQSSNILRNTVWPESDRPGVLFDSRRACTAHRLGRSRQPVPGSARRHPARLHAVCRSAPFCSDRNLRAQRALRERHRLHDQFDNDRPPGLVEDAPVQLDEV